MSLCPRCDHECDGDFSPEQFCVDCAFERCDTLQEAIEKHLPALRKMSAQIISPADNTFSRMVADFEEALK